MDKQEQTHFGGILTIFVKAVMIYLVVSSGKKMLYREDSNLSNTEVPYKEGQEQKFKISQLNEIHYAVIDHNDKYYTVEEISRFIEIIPQLISFEYNDGVEERKIITNGTVVDCTEKDFKKDQNQKNYYRQIQAEKLSMICLSDEVKNWTIQGNVQDNFLYKRPNSYVSIGVFRCQNTDAEPNKCASYEEINKWLYTKQLEPLAFNLKPAMKNFDTHLIDNLL